MECPYCNAELVWEDSYGTAEYIIYGNENYKFGDIYKCPNRDGFETQEEVLEYFDMTEEELPKYLTNHGLDSWEEISCDSCMFSVSGSFYTDKQGNLHEGYPC